jgi:hypothetical protein
MEPLSAIPGAGNSDTCIERCKEKVVCSYPGNRYFISSAISDTGEYLAHLSETFASQKILISGFLADESLISKYSNLFY